MNRIIKCLYKTLYVADINSLIKSYEHRFLTHSTKDILDINCHYFGEHNKKISDSN